MIDYTGLNLFEVQEIDIDIYLFLMREAYIHHLSQTDEGREYLENCWRITQTAPDRKALRQNFKRKESH